MKITAINSSHRGNNGYTRFLLDKLLDGATNAGADCEVITLSELEINQCLSCGVCHTENHYLKCIYHDKDDVAMIFDKMIEADIIVYATPIYIFNMSGLMKTLIDRLYSTMDVTDFRLTSKGDVYHHINEKINSKPFVTLVCLNSLEDEDWHAVHYYFSIYSKFMNAPQAGFLVRNGGSLSGHGKDPNRETNVPKIYDVYNAYEQAGRELVTDGFIHKRTQRCANQELISIPFFKKLKKFKRIKRKILKTAIKKRSILHPLN